MKSQEYNAFSIQDMAQLQEICSDLMTRGSHGHIFCSQQQFKEWINRVNEVKESVKYENLNGTTLKVNEILYDYKQNCLLYVSDKTK